MLPNITNLLPGSNIRAFRKVYFFRIVTCAACVATLLIVIHAILLFPTHMLLASQFSTREIEVQQLRASSAFSDEALLEARLADLLKSASRIEALHKERPVGRVLYEILAIPRSDILLSSFVYQTQSGVKKVSTITLTGVAGTRDHLRTYQVALQELPIVLTADLPVSAYTKEIKIPFTIVLTLRPQ